jgi:hypothetical protein
MNIMIKITNSDIFEYHINLLINKFYKFSK